MDATRMYVTGIFAPVLMFDSQSLDHTADSPILGSSRMRVGGRSEQFGSWEMEFEFQACYMQVMRVCEPGNPPILRN